MEEPLPQYEDENSRTADDVVTAAIADGTRVAETAETPIQHEVKADPAWISIHQRADKLLSTVDGRRVFGRLSGLQRRK